MSNHAWVCFTCKAAYRRSSRDPRVRCASCGVGLIRFRGHLPYGGYDVQTDGSHTQAPASPAIR
jgi:hypothetical protein